MSDETTLTIPDDVRQLAELPGDSEYWRSHDGSRLNEWWEPGGDWVVLNPYEWGRKEIERSICKVVARVTVPFGEPKLQRPIHWERRYWAVRDAADRYMTAMVNLQMSSESGSLERYTAYKETKKELLSVLDGDRNTDTREDWERRALDLAEQLEEVKRENNLWKEAVKFATSQLRDADRGFWQFVDAIKERDALRTERDSLKACIEAMERETVT